MDRELGEQQQQQIFPKWTNYLPLISVVGLAVAAIVAVAFVWYYFSPEYTDVGYRPKQPVAFSHKLHAGDLGLDCRYCHSNVEVSVHANVPPTQTCMSCHTMILPESEKLLPVRESYSSDKPIEWVRVHKLPDFVYFNHSAHVLAGVGCESCHGNIAQSEVVMQRESLSMGWCLDCHRHPAASLRPPELVTQMGWQPPANQLELAEIMIVQKHIAPPEDCSGCHR